MTFAVAIGWSLVRSLLIAVIGVTIAKVIVRWLEETSQRTTWLWAALLIPFLTPSLVTGFCYRDTAMSLLHRPLLKEILYGLIVGMQLVPVAVVLLKFAPAPQVPQSSLLIGRRHLRSRWQYLRLCVQSRLQFDLVAAALLFLLSFQEAELASLMQAASWTEWLFTRHAGGLLLSESLRLIVLPIVVQLPCLVSLLWWLRDEPQPVRPVAEDNEHAAREFTATAAKRESVQKATHGTPLHRPGEWKPARRRMSPRTVRWLTYGWVLASIIVVAVIPTWQLLTGALRGSGGIWQQPTLLRELGDSLLLAVTCGGLVGLSGKWLMRSTPPRWLLFLLLLPGSIGNLVLGLLFAGIFQTPGIRWAYDSPLPLIIAEVLWLLPRTLILMKSVSRSQAQAAEHQVVLLRQSADPQQLLSARELSWRLSGRVWLLVAVLLCFWSYLELMLPSILVFPGMAPVSLVLYNAMHYGRISLLGAKLFVALLTPMAIVIILLLLRRQLTKQFDP